MVNKKKSHQLTDGKLNVDFFQVLPKEVISENILPNLGGNDLLRFRRVCRLARILADDYMSFQKIRTQQEIEVKLRHIVPMGSVDLEHHENVRELNWTGSGDSKVGGSISKLISLKETKIKGTLGYILELNRLVAMGKLYLNSCCMHDLWKNPEMPMFMYHYSEQITQLRLNRVNLPLDKDGRNFLGKFGNLRVLEIEEVSSNEITELAGPWEVIPSNFQKLQTLKIQRFKTPPLRKSGASLWTACQEFYKKYCLFVRKCCINESLEHLNFPAQIEVPGKDKMHFMQEYLECLSDIINWRRSNQPGQSNLKEVDLRNFWFPGTCPVSVRKFLEFGTLCRQHHIKLLTFDRTICLSLMRSTPTPENFAKFVCIMNECVASVRNLQDVQFWTEMELSELERVLITRTSLCALWSKKVYGERPHWSKLTTLHMTVDPEVCEGKDESFEKAVGLFRFFFDGIVRESMTELKLKFIESKSATFVCPIAHYIGSACPNLKILAIDHWTEGIQQLSWLWGDLPLLEELYLGNCPDVDINSFTGGNYRNPSFLNLTRLKKLKLNNLEMMQKIDDSIFRVILCHMSLRELELNCERPIKNLTIEGIRSLLNRRFAMSIEKFHLVGHLKLDGVSESDMRKLGKKFRASKRI